MRPEGIEALREQWNQAEGACQTAREEKRPPEEVEGLYQALRAARKELDTPVLHLAARLMVYLVEFYQERLVPHDRRLMLREFLGAFRLQSHGVFLQEIADVPQREAKLLEYQEEMRAFTEGERGCPCFQAWGGSAARFARLPLRGAVFGGNGQTPPVARVMCASLSYAAVLSQDGTA